MAKSTSQLQSDKQSCFWSASEIIFCRHSHRRARLLVLDYFTCVVRSLFPASETLHAINLTDDLVSVSLCGHTVAPPPPGHTSLLNITPPFLRGKARQSVKTHFLPSSLSLRFPTAFRVGEESRSSADFTRPTREVDARSEGEKGKPFAAVVRPSLSRPRVDDGMDDQRR